MTHHSALAPFPSRRQRQVEPLGKEDAGHYSPRAVIRDLSVQCCYRLYLISPFQHLFIDARARLSLGTRGIFGMSSYGRPCS